MKYLLDTHTFLWFLADDPQLSQRAREQIEDVANEILLSVASIWEIAIKVSLGKLSLSQPFATLIPTQLEQNNIQLLHITIKHTAQLISMPFHHRDPFDRLIVAQAQIEQTPIISADTAIDVYGVIRIW